MLGEVLSDGRRGGALHKPLLYDIAAWGRRWLSGAVKAVSAYSKANPLLGTRHDISYKRLSPVRTRRMLSKNGVRTSRPTEWMLDSLEK